MKYFQIFSLWFWVEEGPSDFWAQPLPVVGTCLSKKLFLFFKNH
jgi:hypothetical protein